MGLEQGHTFWSHHAEGQLLWEFLFIGQILRIKDKVGRSLQNQETFGI
jgi:hypothetical protein